MAFVAALRARHEAARAALALVPLAFLTFLPLVLGRVLFERDILTYWLAQVETFVRTVAAGCWPVWDPWVAFGQPMLAQPDTQVLYPFTWLNLVLPLAAGYTVFVLVHLVLSGTGLFRLARLLGAERRRGARGRRPLDAVRALSFDGQRVAPSRGPPGCPGAGGGQETPFRRTTAAPLGPGPGAAPPPTMTASSPPFSSTTSSAGWLKAPTAPVADTLLALAPHARVARLGLEPRLHRSSGLRFGNWPAPAVGPSRRMAPEALRGAGPFLNHLHGLPALALAGAALLAGPGTPSRAGWWRAAHGRTPQRRSPPRRPPLPRRSWSRWCSGASACGLPGRGRGAGWARARCSPWRRPARRRAARPGARVGRGALPPSCGGTRWRRSRTARCRRPPGPSAGTSAVRWESGAPWPSRSPLGSRGLLAAQPGLGPAPVRHALLNYAGGSRQRPGRRGLGLHAQGARGVFGFDAQALLELAGSRGSCGRTGARARTAPPGGVPRVALHAKALRLPEVRADVYAEPIRVFRWTRPAGYAEGVRVVADDPSLLTRVRRREVLLTEGLPPRRPGGDSAGESRVVYLPDRVEMDVTARRAAVVVLVDSFDPGWRAWVDGEPAPILRANVAFAPSRCRRESIGSRCATGPGPSPSGSPSRP